MPWHKTGETHYHAQLRVTDKGLVFLDGWQIKPLDLFNGLEIIFWATAFLPILIIYVGICHSGSGYKVYRP